MLGLQIFAQVAINMLIPLLLFQVGPEWFMISSMILIGWNTFAKLAWFHYTRQLIDSIRQDAGLPPLDERKDDDSNKK